MKRILTLLVLAILIALLILIRMFEDQVFYDPLLAFFRNDHLTQMLPEFDKSKLLLNVFLRYFSNTLISLTILWIVFKDLEILKISAFLFVIFFIILSIGFYIAMESTASGPHMFLFYIRRFLIQPLLLLVLLPAFYFHRKNK